MRTAELLDTKTSTVPAQETEQAQPRQATPDTLRGQFVKVESDTRMMPEYTEYKKMATNPDVCKSTSERELKSKRVWAVGNAALRLAEMYPEEKYKQRDIATLMSVYPGWVMAEQWKKIATLAIGCITNTAGKKDKKIPNGLLHLIMLCAK